MSGDKGKRSCPPNTEVAACSGFNSFYIDILETEPFFYWQRNVWQSGYSFIPKAPYFKEKRIKGEYIYRSFLPSTRFTGNAERKFRKAHF